MTKFLKSDSDMEMFKQMQCYKEITAFVTDAAASVAGTSRAPPAKGGGLLPLEETPKLVQLLTKLLRTIRELIDSVPLEDLGKQRFGNKAFRTVHAKLTEQADELLKPIAEHCVAGAANDTAVEGKKEGEETVEEKKEEVQTATVTLDEAKVKQLVADLKAYLLDSFGNSTRIDYGTGHELHFIILCFICAKVYHGGNGKITNTFFLRGFIFHVFHEYLELMRHCQSHYRMEPAGSHGVFGLDDFHHFPYIVGASQLIGMESVLPCKMITDKNEVERYHTEYMYLGMVQWINTNKRGPFHEHSSVLYNVSGLTSWEKTMGGMYKMFIGEVLTKRNVTQHLLFSTHFAWE